LLLLTAAESLAFPTVLPSMLKSLTSRRRSISKPSSCARLLCATNSNDSNGEADLILQLIVGLKAAEEGETTEKATQEIMKAVKASKDTQERVTVAEGLQWLMFTDLFSDEKPIPTNPAAPN
jgi:hypothetical protein